MKLRNNNKLHENEMKFWTFAFEDLNKTLERIPNKKREEYFKKLYYQNVDYLDIKKEVLQAADYGHNIIIQGLAGSGKTTLVKRYVIDDDFRKKNLKPLYVSTMNDNKTIGYVYEFVKEVTKYIEEVKQPIDVSQEDIVDEKDCFKVLRKLRDSTLKLDIPLRNIRPLVFFDDLDYAEDEWKKITNLLRDFIADSNITFVFTLRPRLETIILNDLDDRIRYLYHNTEKAIMLIPNVLEIILNRIHIIIDSDSYKLNGSVEQTNIFKRIFNYFNSYEHKTEINILRRFMEELGIENIDELSSKIRFPFQEAYLDFMKKITGSNLRRIFYIARDTIFYLRSNQNVVLENNRNGFWEIDKDIVAKLFMNNNESSWNFLDINNVVLRDDTSLYYSILAILHTMPENEICDEKSYKIINNIIKYANTAQIEEACHILADKKWALLDFIGYFDNNRPMFKLNKKGLYYLEVSNWPQYIKAYGHHNFNNKSR